MEESSISSMHPCSVKTHLLHKRQDRAYDYTYLRNSVLILEANKSTSGWKPRNMSVSRRRSEFNFHSVSTCILGDKVSASTFSTPGMWAALTQRHLVSHHCQIKRVRSLCSSDFDPSLFTQLTVVVLSDITLRCLSLSSARSDFSAKSQVRSSR